MKTNFTKVLTVFSLYFLFTTHAFARGGGGGSGGGGGGGGGGSSGGSYSSGSGNVSDGYILFRFALIIAVVLFLVFTVWKQRKEQLAEAKADITKAASFDSVWNTDALRARITEVFTRFQNDWSNLDPSRMQEYLMPEFYNKMVLELGTLDALHRKNLVQNPVIKDIEFLVAQDSEDNTKDHVYVEITASAHDVLLDTETNKELFVDDSTFTEYWTFNRDGDVWKLGKISQETEDADYWEKDIENFAKKNNFHYDPDFGWLMLPYKGALFGATKFGTSDVNNHVAGTYHGKLVEFYTYIPNPDQKNATNYLVAQAVLPIKHNDILVKKKKMLFNFAPKGLRKIETESIDFNKKFVLFAAPGDEAKSFELLAPNFMEKIYALPFELNIEVVGNVLYFYSESRANLDYDKLLEILSWAFDEMKM